MWAFLTDRARRSGQYAEKRHTSWSRPPLGLTTERDVQVDEKGSKGHGLDGVKIARLRLADPEAKPSGRHPQPSRASPLCRRQRAFASQLGMGSRDTGGPNRGPSERTHLAQVVRSTHARIERPDKPRSVQTPGRPRQASTSLSTVGEPLAHAGNS